MSTRGRLGALGLVWLVAALAPAASLAASNLQADGSVGAGGEIEVSTLGDGMLFEIGETVGSASGANLFHSFLHFDLEQGDTARFTSTGTTPFRNVIARFTGGRPTVNGRVESTVPGADLYFLSRDGFLLGSGSEIDVEGSFYLAGVDQLEFGPGEPSWPSAGASPASLARVDPVAFGFFEDPSGGIEIAGFLEVGPGRTLGIAGAGVSIDGGVLSALEGDVFLASVDSSGRLTLPASLGDAPGLEGFERLGDIALLGEAIVSSSGLTPVLGDLFAPSTAESDLLQLRTRNVAAGQAFEPPPGELLLIDPDADDPNPGARQVLTYFVKPDALALARGAGSVSVQAHDLRIEDSEIRAVSVGSDAVRVGSIDIALSGDLDVQKRASLADVGIFARSGLVAGGFGVAPAPTTGCLGAAVGCVPVPGSPGLAEYGPLEIPLLAGNARGGDIRISATNVRLVDGARVSTTTQSRGAPGSIGIAARDEIRVVGVDPPGSARDFRSSAIFSNHQGEPDRSVGGEVGGQIDLAARSLLLMDGGGVFAQTTGDGDAGAIAIEVDRLEIRGDSQIDSSTSGSSRQTDRGDPATTGAGGPIEVIAHDSVLLTGGTGPDAFARISTFSGVDSAGGAGTISLTTGSLVLRDGAGIAVTTRGEGTGGDIDLATSDFRMQSGARVAADSDSTTNPAGNVRVESSGPIAILTGSSITATTGVSTGGSIEVVAGDVLALGSQTRIEADAALPGGSGGRVRIEAPLVVRAATSSVSASAPGGPEFQGTVDINSPVVALEDQLKPPASDYLDASSMLGSACAARRSGDRAGSLRVARYPALPIDDDGALRSLPPQQLADVDTLEEDFADASQRLLEAADRAGRAGDEASAARALAHAARVELERKAPARGAELLQSAVERVSKLDVGTAAIALRLELADGYARLAREQRGWRRSGLTLAHRLLMEASSEAGRLEDDRARSSVLGRLAALYAQEGGRTREAVHLNRRALAAAERADAPDLLARWFHQAGTLASDLGDREHAREHHRRAVDLVETIRSEALARDGASEDDFRREVAPIYSALVESLLVAAGEDASDAQSTLREARDTVERWKVAELRDYFRDECIAELEAQQQPLEEIASGAAVVYPILLEDRLELLVATQRGLTRHRVGVSRAELLDRVARFRRQLTIRSSYRFLASARQLHAWLVEPYRASLEAEGIDTLVFVPDGMLRTIPMSALYDGERYLVDDFAVAVTPTLRLIAPRRLEPRRARLLLAGVSESVQGFPELPHVRGEIESIQRLYGGEVLLDAGFHNARFEDALRERRPAIVHIASHAKFTGDPRESYVLSHDGRLTMSHLSDLIRSNRFGDEPIEMILLSACETAAGDERAALGLAGLAVRSGARSAVGSLWPVNDEATSKLIVSFYESLDRAEGSKAEALARAQRELIRNERFDHPYYWAGFMVINNWL